MLWLVLGIIIGGGLAYIIQDDRIKPTWYQWLLGTAALILLLLTIQNCLGFVRELESAAVSFTLIVMGLPAVILGTLAVFLPRLIRNTRNKANKDMSGETL